MKEDKRGVIRYKQEKVKKLNHKQRKHQEELHKVSKYSLSEFRSIKKITNWIIFGITMQVIFTLGVGILWLWFPIAMVGKIKKNYHEVSKSTVYLTLFLTIGVWIFFVQEEVDSLYLNKEK